jgi:hypothetical protein
MGMSREEFVARMTADMAKKKKERDSLFRAYQHEQKLAAYQTIRGRERYFRTR